MYKVALLFDLCYGNLQVVCVIAQMDLLGTGAITIK